MLQTTLDPEAMLGLFSGEINEVVTHDSIGYDFADRGLNVAIGKPALHSCTCRMLVEQEYLGEVTFTHAQAFFKNINDTYGHSTGDVVIKAIAYVIWWKMTEKTVLPATAIPD